MPMFFYQGVTRQGVRQQGELIATSPQEAARILRQRQVAVTRLREKTSTSPLQINLGSWGRARDQELAAFTHQFAALLHAGVPLIESLDILAGHVDQTRLRDAIRDVRHRVESGSTLADALRGHPRLFPPLYAGLIEAGEAGGFLDRALARLASHHRNIQSLKRRVRSALAYPLVVVVLAALVVIFLLVWVVPVFQALYADFDAILPWPTVVVLTISNGLAQYGFLALVGGLAVLYGLYRIRQSPAGRLMMDRWLLRLPLVGPMTTKSLAGQMVRTLGALVSSGVAIVEALVTTAKSVSNRELSRALYETADRVREGSTLAESMACSGVFPPLVMQMMRVGESTGSLDTILTTLGDLYEEEVSAAIETMTSVLEPVVIALLGIGIGFIVLAMYLPVFSMNALMFPS